MSEFYDKIARGLNEAIAFEKGKLPAKTTKHIVTPVTSFAPGEIKEIRTSTGMTQAVFAAYMGVSKKKRRSLGIRPQSSGGCRLPPAVYHKGRPLFSPQIRNYSLRFTSSILFPHTKPNQAGSPKK